MAGFVSRQIVVPIRPKLASDYAVGDIVKLPVNNVDTDFIVVHQGNPDSSIYDASCNGTWLLMKDCYIGRQWHSSNVNDYANSTIKSYIDSTIYGLLNAAAKSAVKQVKIPYRSGSGTSKTVKKGTSGLSCKAFLLSCAEVGYTTAVASNLPTNEGKKLDYFDSATSGGSVKLSAYFNGSLAHWWLRTPYCGGSNRAFYVSQSTTPVFDLCSTTTYGGPICVRPAFIINSDTKFDPDTNVIKG